MAYHGLIPLFKKHLRSVSQPTFLEVGVDRGVTFIPLVAHLARTVERFFALGIDVMVQEQVNIVLANLDLLPTQQAHLVEDNSLSVLPKILEQGLRFDLVLVDGDHNYHTVSKELPIVASLVNPGGMIAVDDYTGRWATRDLWYSERSGYEDNKNVSARVDTEKSGVQPAVDEWLSKNPGWLLERPVGGEPVVLRRHS